MALIDQARYYHELGFNILPLHTIREGRCSCGSSGCGRPGKHPRTRWRQLQEKPLTLAQLEKSWEKWPDANIGVITGQTSGVAVLDVDGEAGLAALEEAGMPLSALPATPTVATGGGGYHLYYRFTPEAKTSGGVLDHVDIRAEGGLAVLPPSTHISGLDYKWVKKRSLEDLDFADLDFTKLASAAESVETTATRWYELLLQGVAEPGRNVAATRLAGRYLAMGMTPVEVTAILTHWNESANTPPLPIREIRRTVQSIAVAESEMTRGDILKWLSDRLKLDLQAVNRISGDHPVYILEFSEGLVRMTTAELLSPSGFQQAIVRGTNRVVPKPGPRTHPSQKRLLEAITRAAVEVDAGEEATGAGEMRLMVVDYLTSHSSIPEKEALRGPFIHGDRAWMDLADLVQRVSVRWGTKVRMADAAQTLRAMGVIRKKFTVADGTVRDVWGISLDFVPTLRAKVADHGD